MIKKIINYSTLSLGFIFLLVILVYLPTAPYFIASDGYWVNRASTLTFKSIFGLHEINYLRATVVIYFYFTQKIWGLNIFYFQIVNILIHISNCILLFKICQFILKKLSFKAAVAKEISIFSVLIFAFFSPSFQPIIWIACVTDLLVVLFILLAMYLFFVFLKNKSFGLYLFSLIFFIFSLLTKELAFILPFILIFYLFLFRKQHPPKYIFVLPFFILNFFYFYIYYKFYLPLSNVPVVLNFNFFITYFYFWIDLFGGWLGILNPIILPFSQNYLFKELLIGFSILGIIIFIFKKSQKKGKLVFEKMNYRLIFFLLGWMFLAFLPAIFSPEVNNRNTILSRSRYLYFSGCAASFFIAYLYLNLFPKISFNFKLLLIIFLTGIILKNINIINFQKKKLYKFG